MSSHTVVRRSSRRSITARKATAATTRRTSHHLPDWVSITSLQSVHEPTFSAACAEIIRAVPSTATVPATASRIVARRVRRPVDQIPPSTHIAPIITAMPT